MRVLKQWLLRQLSRKARPYLKSYGLLQTVKHKPALIWDPAGERVVVLAPHMDDEVIGCGGALYKHTRNGAEVTVVYLTDGRYSTSAPKNVSGKEKRRREDKLAERRKREAQLAMETLGIKQGVFLDAEETKLTSTKEIQNKLRQILDSIQPDIVYLPFFLEEHPEHKMTNQILLDATKGANFEFDCYGYEVWTPLFPNCLVEITDVIEIKKQALQHYQSQLVENNYIHTALGLNAYRSGTLLDNNGEYVEAFFLTSLKEYRELYKAFNGLFQRSYPSRMHEPGFRM